MKREPLATYFALSQDVPRLADSRQTRLEAALRFAVDRKELSLAYQPQVCLTSGEIVGAQALLRWCSPEFGDVSPTEFVPLAERSSLIATLGEWVLQQSCRQLAAWTDDRLPQIRLGVNIAPAQFHLTDVTRSVRHALREAGVPPERFGIEVTEAALLHDPDRVADVLRELQADGMEIALDDFGTGYTSLSRLRDTPIDIVKIDRSFVHDVAAAASSASLTRAVIHLAHGLHMRVLAEGVETEEQLQQLLANGCDRIQGFYFSRPVQADALADMLRRQHRLPRELTHRVDHVRTLLLVDDEEHILSALKRLFRRDGYRILTATSGAQALELLATNAVDAIISDQRMPGMTGVEFLNRAKALYPSTVRMTLSGYTDLQSIIDAVNEGAVYKFLTKPWDDARLREHVAQAFRQCEMADENLRLTRAVGSANTELAEANRRLGHLVGRQRERAEAMQDVAGHAHDMVDGLPMALFGLDPEGVVVYVNRRAIDELPDWAAWIGSTAPAEMTALIDLLRAGPPDACSSGQAVMLFGRPFRAWLSSMGDESTSRGEILSLSASIEVAS